MVFGGLVDDRDLKILKILEEDSRKAWSSIARDLKVSETTVYLRVKRMNKLGILSGFTVRVDPEKLGLKVTLFLLLKAEASKVDRVGMELSKVEFLDEVYQVAGSHQFLAKASLPSYEHALKAIERVASIDGVYSVETIVSLRTIKREDNYVSKALYWLEGGQARASGH
ncbi:MAG: Lrp/AsnC family transcriptional regulator [Desulfurococcales archaeon]|nr:Lrp/AsnC family transcriptional regulator [Desulfurococcales archaeon]